jgi:xanthine/uracil permease
VLALILGDVDTSAIAAAPWIGLPEFQTPTFTVAVLPMFPPAVIALIAGGHRTVVVPQGRRGRLGHSAGRARWPHHRALRTGSVLGIRTWLTNDVDFSKPLNQMTAAIPLIIGIADFTWQLGDLTFTGIALGSIAALVVYHGMRLLGLRTRT